MICGSPFALLFLISKLLFDDLLIDVLIVFFCKLEYTFEFDIVISLTGTLSLLLLRQSPHVSTISSKRSSFIVNGLIVFCVIFAALGGAISVVVYYGWSFGDLFDEVLISSEYTIFICYCDFEPDFSKYDEV